MRNPSKNLLALLAIATLVASSTVGSTNGLAAREPQPELTQPIYLKARHGDDEDMPHASSMASNSTHHIAPDHAHGHDHGLPKLELNETEILEKFGPDPLSYYAHDFQLEGEKGLGGLMIFHIAVMSLAFFVVLPSGEPELSCRRYLDCID